MRLEFEIESGLLEPAIRGFVESIQPRGAMGDVLLDLIRVRQQAHAQDFFAEVSFVEQLLENRFVQALQIRQRKFLRQQLEADWLVANLPLQPPQRDVENLFVVERERGQIRNRKPRD